MYVLITWHFYTVIEQEFRISSRVQSSRIDVVVNIVRVEHLILAAQVYSKQGSCMITGGYRVIIFEPQKTLCA